jgi:hypothetical protein
MKINFKTCIEEDLWKYVASHLAKNHIESVLVGGAVVSVYTGGLYQSGDLDFIILSLFKDRLPKVMKEIGFQKKGRHYVHPDCKHLFVEFPPGPLAIGEDTDLEPNEKRVEGAVIKILSPTDCIKDRLASYIHFKSRDTLEQAVLVAQKQPFKIAAVKKWCEGENALDAFEEFRRLIATKSAPA